MIEISIPAYLVEVIPQFCIIFTLQSLIMFKKVKWSYLLLTVAFVSGCSVLFNTLGEMFAGAILLLLLLHLRQYSDSVILILLWDSYMIIVNLIALLTPVVSHIVNINKVDVSCYLSIGIYAFIIITISLGFRTYQHRFRDLFRQLNDDQQLCQIFMVYSLIVCGCLYTIELGSEFINFSIRVELLLMSTFLAMLVINIGALYFLSRAINARANNRILQSAAKDKAQYYADVELQQMRTRKVIHDYKNVLSSLQLSLDNATNTAATDQTSNLITRAQTKLNNLEPSNSALTTVSTLSLRGLLYLKWTQAHSQDILLNIQTDGTISINNDDDLLDILRIVGILVDNAIEASTASDEVDVLLMSTAKELTITVINIVASSFKLMSLNNVGYTTKGVGHGTGLGNIRELIHVNHHLSLLKNLTKNKLTITLSIEVN